MLRRLLKSMAVFAALAILGSGCGDAASVYDLDRGYVAEEWDGPTSTVFLDIESYGSMEKWSWAKGSKDTASVTCQFAFGSATLPNGYIRVMDGGAGEDCSNAPNPDRCILCSASAASGNCTLTCNGTVPSNATAAAEELDIDLVFTSAFTSDLAQINVGAVRFEGAVSESWVGAEFLGNLPTNDITGCNASEEEFAINDTAASPNDAIDGDNDGFYESWEYQAFVSAFGQDSNRDGFRGCTVETTFDTDIALTGVDTPGARIDLSTLGSVSLTSYVCDDAQSCPPPN